MGDLKMPGELVRHRPDPRNFPTVAEIAQARNVMDRLAEASPPGPAAARYRLAADAAHNLCLQAAIDMQTGGRPERAN